MILVDDTEPIQKLWHSNTYHRATRRKRERDGEITVKVYHLSDSSEELPVKISSQLRTRSHKEPMKTIRRLYNASYVKKRTEKDYLTFPGVQEDQQTYAFLNNGRSRSDF